MELTDDNPEAFGAGTEARKDLYCTNEDAGLWWDLLDAQARKYNGDTLCLRTPRAVTTTQRTVLAGGASWCAFTGSHDIYVIGTHGATRPGGGPVPRRSASLTPAVFTF